MHWRNRLGSHKAALMRVESRTAFLAPGMKYILFQRITLKQRQTTSPIVDLFLKRALEIGCLPLVPFIAYAVQPH